MLENDRIPESVLRSLGNQGAVTMHPIIRDNNSSSCDFGDEPSFDHQLWMTRLANRADQLLGVTPDTLVEGLYRIPDTYLANMNSGIA